MKIINIEGIGPVYAQKLSQININTIEKLLKLGASKKGREEISTRSGVSETLILEWVNLADLMRIKGIGEEYSDLLEEAGVDTVKELRNRNPENLFKALQETNEQKKLVRRPPAKSQVIQWVEQAKELPPLVTY